METKKLSLIKATEELIVAVESNIENITVLNRENEPVIQLCFIIEEIENLKRALKQSNEDGKLLAELLTGALDDIKRQSV